MRIQVSDTGVKLWASANDTYWWARRPGSSWPCSTIAGNRFFAEFDSNGLLDYTINGKYPYNMEWDGHEFNAICADMLAEKLPEEHPVYFVAVGQFEDENIA